MEYPVYWAAPSENSITWIPGSPGYTSPACSGRPRKYGWRWGREVYFYRLYFLVTRHPLFNSTIGSFRYWLDIPTFPQHLHHHIIHTKPPPACRPPVLFYPFPISGIFPQPIILLAHRQYQNKAKSTQPLSSFHLASLLDLLPCRRGGNRTTISLLIHSIEEDRGGDTTDEEDIVCFIH